MVFSTKHHFPEIKKNGFKKLKIAQRRHLRWRL